MVVGGIPSRVPDHATRVTSQAIDMVRLAREVAHPLTGNPVQVRRSLGIRFWSRGHRATIEMSESHLIRTEEVVLGTKRFRERKYFSRDMMPGSNFPFVYYIYRL